MEFTPDIKRKKKKNKRTNSESFNDFEENFFGIRLSSSEENSDGSSGIYSNSENSDDYILRNYLIDESDCLTPLEAKKIKPFIDEIRMSKKISKTENFDHLVKFTEEKVMKILVY